MRSILRFPREEITIHPGAGGEWDQPRHQGVEEGAEVVAEAGEEGEVGDLLLVWSCMMTMKVTKKMQKV